MRRNWFWAAIIVSLAFTVLGAQLGSEVLVGVGSIVSLVLMIVVGALASRSRKGARYSKRGSLFDD